MVYLAVTTQVVKTPESACRGRNTGKDRICGTSAFKGMLVKGKSQQSEMWDDSGSDFSKRRKYSKVSCQRLPY